MIHAMFALVILTVVIGIITVKTRFSAVKAKTLSPHYFKLMQGEDIPKRVTQTTRCFNNLFEVPTLFYVVCTLYIVLGIESEIANYLAYSFVFLRIVVAYIHITYNHVMHRMLTFVASVLCVLALWVNLVITL